MKLFIEATIDPNELDIGVMGSWLEEVKDKVREYAKLDKAELTEIPNILSI
jgi:hypothetical protein